MLRARSTRFPRLRWASSRVVSRWLLTTATAFGQVSTTATVRGTVEDSSGGVLPGATVTHDQHRHEGGADGVTDDRGQYQFWCSVPAAPTT